MTLVILATGVLGVSALLAVQGRQIRQVEAWCREAPTYYLLTHTNRWMRRLEAGAELHAQAGQTPWSPPVAGQQEYHVQLTALSQELDSRTIEAKVTLVEAGE